MNIMKTYIKAIICSIILGVTFSSCTNDFDNINIDPNNPAEPNTALLISNAIRQLGNQNNGIAGWAKDLYPQYASEIQYTSESRFQNKFYDFAAYYNGPLMDLQTVINLNSSEETSGLPYVQAGGSNTNQIAVARILKAFYFLHMTDRWGMLPYTEALMGSQALTPKYDSQESIYAGIFTELKEAVAQIDEEAAINGDILFEGDLSHWIKWANTIRMTAALHLSEVNEQLAQTEFTDALNAGVLESNSDNVYFRYLADFNNQNPLYNNYFVANRTDYAVSETIVDFMNDIDDPRLPVYANPTVQGNAYIGMPYGLAQGDDNLNQETVSLIGDKFTAQDYALPITTFAQVEFMKAEAVFRGWISGTVLEYYQSGIEASMQQHGVTAPATYFTQAGVALGANNILERIISQKWLANYQANGYESWVDWRRTGFPILSPGPAPLSDHRGIPYRQAYPNTESGLNGVNYAAAVAAQGPDELSTKLWWDVD